MTNAEFEAFESPHPLSSCSDITFCSIDLARIIAVPLCWLRMAERKGQGVKVGQPFWSFIWIHMQSQSLWGRGQNQFAPHGNNNQSKTIDPDRVCSQQRGKTTFQLSLIVRKETLS